MNTERRIIISPMVHLLELMQQQWKGVTPRREHSDEGIVNGWILNLLPRDLRAMAEERHDQLVRLDIVALLKDAISAKCVCFPRNCHKD